jgi:hypothetical protein
LLKLSGSDLERFNRQQQLQQYELDTRMQANEDIPPSQRLLLDYGGYFSPQYFSIDDANNDNHGLREYDLVGYLRANFDGANEVFLRGRVQYNDYNPGDSFDGFGSRVVNPDFDRAYYKFDLQQYESAYQRQTTRRRYHFRGRPGFRLLGQRPDARPGRRWRDTVVQVEELDTDDRRRRDAHAHVDFEPDRPAFDYDTRRGFYGGLLSVAVGPAHPYVFGLIQRDYNVNHNLSVVGPITTRYSYNSDYLGAGISGSLSDHFAMASKPSTNPATDFPAVPLSKDLC